MSPSSGERARVLYVDPDDDAATSVIEALERGNFVVDRVPDAASARARLPTDGGNVVVPTDGDGVVSDDGDGVVSDDGDGVGADEDSVVSGSIDCVVSEQTLPDGSGLDLLRWVRETRPDLPFVLFTADGDEGLASDAISAGVSDYVPREPAGRQRLALVDAVGRVVAEGAGFHDVTEELKDLAMDEAPVGITIADASRRDRPLIYVNEAFEDLTGYDEGEALGRNCDFLQGPESDPSAVAEMSRALDDGDPVSVEIQNYAKSGEEFWNRVDIAPVRRDGEMTHYVGFQLDVTERVEAEREARRQAEKARAERQTVEALLARLDGLVTDVTSQLLNAETRDAVESAVCERLVETDEYALAWIGDRDPATETVAPSTWAGGEPPASFAVDLADESAVSRAIATGDLQVVTAADADTDPDAAAELDRYARAVGEDVAAVAAVPLRYGDVGYGVLVVGVGPETELSEPEQRVLAAVGRSTAMALHTLTSQRLLASDEVTELEFALGGPEPFFVNLSAALDASFVHAGTVDSDDGPTMLFFESEADPDEVASLLEGRDDGVTVTPITTGDDRSVLEFTVEASPLVDLLSGRGGRIAEMAASGGVGELTVEIPPEAQPRDVVEGIEDRIEGASLSAYREQERPAETRQDVRARVDEQLTDRQETALQTALVGGFFDWPRDSTGEELAETMDIGRSTFHQHLRAAQRKVFEELYE